jgi:hypothetical protein
MVFIGIERRSLETARYAVPGARFGQPAAGYYGSDASMSDTDPDLTSWGGVKVRDLAYPRPNVMLGWWFREASLFSPFSWIGGCCGTF